MAEVAGVVANPRTRLLHRRSQPEPLQMAHAVWGQKNAGSNLAEGGRLLVDRHLQPMRDQCICGEQAADPATNDRNMGSRRHHHRHLAMSGLENRQPSEYPHTTEVRVSLTVG